jgi:CRP-like cAMP-binding protein
VLGIIFAIIDYVGKTAQVSSISRVFKRSRVVWRPERRKLLDNCGYHARNPKIITLEIKGTIFFGSALQLLSSITEEISIDGSSEDAKRADSLQEHQFTRLTRANSTPSPTIVSRPNVPSSVTETRGTHLIPPSLKSKPRFVVLDLSQVPNIDSSAARGCFLQLAKMCARHGIVLCASGTSPRVDWIFRSHDAAFGIHEEERVKNMIATERRTSLSECPDRILLFANLYEALEFCESKLISELEMNAPKARGGSVMGALVPLQRSHSDMKVSLATAFINILGLDRDEASQLEAFERKEEPFHDELRFDLNKIIFQRGSIADSFYCVLSGSVAVLREKNRSRPPTNILSGAGNVPIDRLRKNNPDIRAFLPPGAVFGFVDFILEKTYSFSAVAAKEGTVVAKLHRSGLDRLKAETPKLEHIVDKVLLQASILELSNAVDP